METDNKIKKLLETYPEEQLREIIDFHTHHADLAYQELSRRNNTLQPFRDALKGTV